MPCLAPAPFPVAALNTVPALLPAAQLMASYMGLVDLD